MNPELRAFLADHDHLASNSDVCRWASVHELRMMLGDGELVRVWRGIYTDIGPPHDLQTRLLGLDRALGVPVTACSHSAAELHGFVVDPGPDVHVVAPEPRALADRPGVVVHRTRPAPLTMVDGRRCTSAASTAVEVARTLSRARALATLDAALRSGTCTVHQLDDAVRDQRGRRGIAEVRRLVALADGLAESPMESETRLVLHDGGLPRPVLQHKLRNRWGRVVHRLDLAWPWAKVAAEYSGVEWHSSRESLQRDHDRAGWITAEGWRTIPLTLPALRVHPGETVRRLEQLLASAA